MIHKELDREGAQGALLTRVIPNTYLDSILLFKWTEMLCALPGIEMASVAMGVPFQLEQLERSGLSDHLVQTAAPNDVVVAVRAHTEGQATSAHAFLDSLISRHPLGDTEPAGVHPARTIERASRRSPEASVAFISVPGQYAALEATQALAKGLAPVIFSDHVGIEDEIKLKDTAVNQGLLVMGPDCGTVLVGDLGLGFVNEVRRGRIGLVAASGTGAQEVSVLIHRFSEGVSHILGVGGRDLSDEVNARSTIKAIDLLAQDPVSEVLVVISKAPSIRAVQIVTEALDKTAKPWVSVFLGLEDGHPRLYSTLAGVARAAVSLAESGNLIPESLPPVSLSGNGVFGAFQGGSLAAEARALLGRRARIVDFGTEEHTRGRPHPIIDPSRRDEAIVALAEGTRVVLADLVLGHGAHPDPAPGLARALKIACEQPDQSVRAHVHVVGTEEDPQGCKRSEEILKAAGWTVHASSTEAAIAAGQVDRS